MKAPLNKEAGFTLLEALISLFITSMVLLIFSGGIQQMSTIDHALISEAQAYSHSSENIKGSRQIEWHIFLNQLEYFLQGTLLIKCENNQLMVNEWDATSNQYEQVRYHQTASGNKNFRRSKNNGNNTMLTDIQTFHLEKEAETLILVFQFRNGEKYTGRILVESWKEVEDVPPEVTDPEDEPLAVESDSETKTSEDELAEEEVSDTDEIPESDEADVLEEGEEGLEQKSKSEKEESEELEDEPEAEEATEPSEQDEP